MRIFMVIVTSIFVIAALLIPKKISKIAIYTTILFVLFLVSVADVVFIFKLNLYGYIKDGIDWFAIPLLIILYPAVGVITINYYSCMKKMWSRLVYTIAAVLVYTGLEGVFLLVHFLHYNTWRLWYSGIAYLLIITLMELNLRLVNKLVKSG